jgi:hypothetical protein
MRLLAASAASLVLGGCLTFGSIENRGAAINEGVGVLQNRAILLNLVRASRAEPLYFTSINSVQAQGAADLKLTAPIVLTGMGLSAAQRAFTWSPGGSTYLDNSTNTNFQVGVYSTQAFYAGMLSPLGLTEVDLLLHQGFPRELVFMLVIDKAKLTNTQTGQSIIVYNDPTSKASYAQFVQAVKSAMVHGLTTEVPLPRGPGEPQPAASGSPPGAPSAPAPISVKPSPPPTPQLCFERALATADSKAEFDQLTAEGRAPNYCGAGPQHRANSRLTVRLFGQDLEVEVTTRSIYGIFRYLGAVMALPPDQIPQLVDYGVPSESTPSGPLLTVDSSFGLAGECFSVVHYEGRTYCVPQDGSYTTKNIFNILSLLVSLKQSPGDLPATATVLVGP